MTDALSADERRLLLELSQADSTPFDKCGGAALDGLFLLGLAEWTGGLVVAGRGSLQGWRQVRLTGAGQERAAIERSAVKLAAGAPERTKVDAANWQSPNYWRAKYDAAVERAAASSVRGPTMAKYKYIRGRPGVDPFCAYAAEQILEDVEGATDRDVIDLAEQFQGAWEDIANQIEARESNHAAQERDKPKDDRDQHQGNEG